jgi:hypothetical protein
MLGDLGSGDATLAAWAAGPFLAACALLVWSGISKLRAPRATRDAAAALGLPATPVAVRTLGVVEVSAGVAGALFGGYAALGAAIIYLALTVAAVRLLRRAPATPCGCLGASEAPVSVAHVAVNVGAVVVSVAAAFDGSPIARIPDLPLAGLPFVVLVLCATWLATLTIDALPALNRAIKEGR